MILFHVWQNRAQIYDFFLINEVSVNISYFCRLKQRQIMGISKIKYLVLTIFMATAIGLSAQNVDSLVVAGDSLRMIYRFEESLQSYNLALEKAIADSLDSVEKIQERIRYSENGRNMMAFTDSPVVEAKHKFSIEDFFLYYPLPDKSWRKTPNQLDSLGGPLARVIYYPDSSDKICYSVTDSSSVRSVYFTELMDSLWSAPSLLDDALYSSSDEIYPMFSPDRKLMYFSSNGLYGVGGYDIYVSKWNEHTSSWGAPMNMGFPYSSPADDFLYATSEDGNYTVFSSNRGCSADSVWVYVLKHQDVPVRCAIVNPEELLALSNLDPVGYEQRIESKALVQTDIPENLDTKKYLDKITEVRALQDSIMVYNDRLEKDRNEYALSTDEDERLELTSKILQQESEIPLIQEKLDKAKVQLHKIEMEFLFRGVVIDPDKLLAQADREVVGEATTYTFEKKTLGPSFELGFEKVQ